MRGLPQSLLLCVPFPSANRDIVQRFKRGIFLNFFRLQEPVPERSGLRLLRIVGHRLPPSLDAALRTTARVSVHPSSPSFAWPTIKFWTRHQWRMGLIIKVREGCAAMGKSLVSFSFWVHSVRGQQRSPPREARRHSQGKLHSCKGVKSPLRVGGIFD